ncbi:MAG: lipoyl synthase [Parachlamydiales bacterium]|nr:lipoyl synthase [Parachlamydiales bacterium]
MNLPSWLKIKIPLENISSTEKIILSNNLNTVCTSAKCPNRSECFSKKTATFLALGSVCTRKCAFCNIEHSKNPKTVDIEEPKNIAKCIKDLKLKHVVITMVTRDDLEDGGSNHIAKILKKIKTTNPKISLEVLVSDFMGNEKSIDTVLNQKPDIFNHNVETVKESSDKIRHIANYERSLKILNYAKNQKKAKFIKSGLMVGLYETKSQVFSTIEDLFDNGCDIITIGQYLQPGGKNLPVKRYVALSEFKEYASYANSLGVKYIYSAPFVRSSYNAEIIFKQIDQN